jgi:hypothetical protein
MRDLAQTVPPLYFQCMRLAIRLAVSTVRPSGEA